MDMTRCFLVDISMPKRLWCELAILLIIRPDSPSRDATNRLSSRFGRYVETRRRYDWLRLVSMRCASSELQFGALRGVVAREKQGVTVAESLVFRVSTH